eukprot:Gb_26268 [translate_table: standard]
MEMESSRRSMDRSRELAIKKARIGDDVERDRGFNRVVERERSLERPAQRGSPLLERFRAIEREREGDRERGRGRNVVDEERVDREKERDDSVRGAQQQQQQHELVSQYKTALGELTFNSKPIITNLTIIAGENIHAAKGIAATVCSNILEVPNEQKLPSLYLLDSIVKNIGGDYVKYFAGRLPEVFCKAYRQVDPATHPGMQHLFRTWRGVFPPAPLRIIEEELQFPPAVNGSSSGTTTPRSSDSQSQRPGHSIHVNPKYLEARQRLQQSNRAEGVSSENNGDEPIQEAERSERTMHASPKAWSDAPLKRPNIQRPPREEAFSEPVYGQKSATGYGDYDFGPDHSRPSEMVGVGRSNDRVTERDDGLERPWYGERFGELESSTTSGTYGQRNGYEWPQLPARGALIDAYGNYRGTRSARGPSHLPPPQGIPSRNNRVISRNWQNSEEEEYMWEDMSTRLVDNGRGGDKMRKGDWFPGDTDKPLGLGRGKRMGPEPDLPDNNWRRPVPLPQMDQPIGGEDRVPMRRELEDHLPPSLLQHDIGTRSSREASVDAPFLLRTTQNASGHLSLPVQSEGQSVPSLNGGLPTSIGPPAGPRTNFRSNNGLGTGPLSFGSIPLVTPVSSGMSLRQRQSQKSPSPSALPSMQQLPCSPPSALPRQQSIQPVQHQQQNNFIKLDHLQVQSLPPHPPQLVQQVPQPLSQMQQVLQPQTAQDSLHQLPHNHAQSGTSLQQLQMPQPMQPLQHFQNPPSSAMLPQQGHQMQFSQQPHMEPPLPQIQPVSMPLQAHSQPLMQSHSLQQAELRSPPQPPSLSYGSPQTMGYVASSISTNPSPSLQGQASTQNLLAAILQSGLFPSQSGQVASNPQPISDFGSSQPPVHIQPPLPSGPPPAQFSTSTTVSLPLPPVVPPLPMPTPVATPVPSLSGPTPGPALVPPPPSNLSVPPQPVRMVQPPLPPGPPPASSLVGSTSQTTSSVATQASSVNPLSSLLSSLVAKGLISAPTESTSSSLSTPTIPLIPNELHNHNAAFHTSNSVQPSVSLPLSAATAVSATVPVLPISASIASPPVTASAEAQIVKDPIGVEFKQEIIRERHASVINMLYEDFPRQCRTCGLRFKFQEEHSKHMDWHASRNREQKSQKKMSRKWYLSLKEWLSGMGVSSSDVAPSFFPEETSLQTEASEQLAVPADDSQSVCALCGEPFEDFYSHETDEWMYKGAVYMNALPEGSIGSKDSSNLGPIVHVKCLSESAAVTLEDFQENDAVRSFFHSC